MPSSPLNGSPQINVRKFLSEILPNATLSDAEITANYEPLLLLRTNHFLAAFAFANGNVAKSYEVLYQGFKREYTKHEGQWNALDMAFVFCVQPGVPHIDEFCSATETDVYFCRKFVVQLSQALASSLARLPFLPLSPLHSHSLRPPSAQTFLQQCGVPAHLAKFIVVQRERSPEGIIEDCTTGKFGDPHSLKNEPAHSELQPDSTNEPVRIESLEIQNFRAYRKTKTFALGSDVTILYGPNGFGKTSFFDAVDFAATGGIGRVDAHRQSAFEKTARHLDSASEESCVSLTFRGKNGTRKIIRSVDDRKNGLIDGRSADRKAILSELTSSTIPATDRIENFVNLFRASHLFSQEQQELTKDFQENCTLSAEIVSRMLAFEDYASAVNKAHRVRDSLEATITDCAETIKNLNNQIVTDNRELERLGQTAKVHSNLESLETESSAIRDKLLSLGVATTSERLDVAMVRGWRASLEARHSQSRTNGERLSLLAKELSSLPRLRTELATAQQQTEVQDQILKLGEEKRAAEELVAQRAAQRLAEMLAKRQEAQRREELFAWVRNTQPIFRRVISQQAELAVELQTHTALLAEASAVQDKTTAELRTLESNLTAVNERLISRRSHLTTAQSLLRTLPTWRANQARLTVVAESEKTQHAILESLKAEERELAPVLTEVNAEEARLVRQISEADKQQSALQVLIAQLRSHVKGALCPLCGVDHGSEDTLIRDIEKNTSGAVAGEARVQLAAVKEKQRQIKERVALNKDRQIGCTASLTVATNERAKINTEIATFGADAARQGIALEGAPSVEEELNKLVGQCQIDIATLETEAKEIISRIETSKKNETIARNNALNLRSQIGEKTAMIKRLDGEVNGLRSDPRLTDISLDIEAEQLNEAQRLNLEHLQQFAGESGKAEAEINESKPRLSMLRQEATAIRGQLSTLRSNSANLQKAIAQILVKTQEAQLPADSTEASVLAMVDEQSRLQAQLLALQDRTSSLELALDAATTAAALTTLRDAVRNREKEVTAAIEKRDRHTPWRKYFDEVSKLVISQQNNAIENFTREYGPRASIIQRRLRSVYGFDDIEIKSQESSISVRVMRNGEELRPTDYFSQSQQQTLLLGIFLTACSSQTWSAFSPIFLDDPVTHFDDLNTYAFLDLVVGLLGSETESRQFIISTCDEKLLQLARQKFRHLGDKARFYRFVSIGANGPMVEES